MTAPPLPGGSRRPRGGRGAKLGGDAGPQHSSARAGAGQPRARARERCSMWRVLILGIKARSEGKLGPTEGRVGKLEGHQRVPGVGLCTRDKFARASVSPRRTLQERCDRLSTCGPGSALQKLLEGQHCLEPPSGPPNRGEERAGPCWAPAAPSTRGSGAGPRVRVTPPSPQFPSTAGSHWSQGWPMSTQIEVLPRV